MGFIQGITNAINSMIGRAKGSSTTGKRGGGAASNGDGLSRLRNDLGLNDLTQTTQRPRETSGVNSLRRDLGSEIVPSPQVTQDTSSQQPTLQRRQQPIVRPTSQQVSTTAPIGTASSSGTAGMVPTNGGLGIQSTLSSTPDQESNEKYENYFLEQGMNPDELKRIDERKDRSWLDTLVSNPTTAAATDGMETPIWHNPYLDISIDDLRDDVDENVNSLMETGDFAHNQIPGKYQQDTDTTIGDIHAVDDGRTMDYDHLTADWATGQAMQKYGELGMGGRGWWLYDPTRTYHKSDEALDHGFRAYLPDDTSRANARIANMLDSAGDATGFLADARELGGVGAILDMIQGKGIEDFDRGYHINYDVDGNPETTDDTLRLNGADFDYRSDAYRHNMDWIRTFDPDQLLNMPEGGELHGAPITTSILETEIVDAYGNPQYIYGDISSAEAYGQGQTLHIPYEDGTSVDIEPEDYEQWLDEKGNLVTLGDWVYDLGDIDYDNIGYNNDPRSYRLFFDGGQTVDVSPETLDELSDPMTAPASTYVYIDDAKGAVPQDYDSLNDAARARTENKLRNAPVLYIPDFVMGDGTRLTSDQFDQIYTDRDLGDNPDTDTDDNVSYEYTWLNRPRRLMESNGQVFGDDMSFNVDNLIPSAIDSTLGSLPIAFDMTGWPLSIANGLSNGLSGMSTGRHDTLTDSDQYMAADYDDDGNLVPTYNDSQQAFGTAGSSLVPLTEMIAGPVSGHSLIEKLSGEVPVNPTLRQLAGAWLSGAIGEGIEEIPGNVFDELTEYGLNAYGDVTDEDGRRLLYDKDPMSVLGKAEPVRNSDGSYRYVDQFGDPLEYSTDMAGHIYKDPDTPLSHRVENFLDGQDLLNAVIGGMLVDSMMTAPDMPGDVSRALMNSRYRRNMGLRQYVTPEAIEIGERKKADPRLVGRFSDQPYVEE